MYNVTCFPSRKAIKGLLLKHTPDRCRTVWFCEDRRTLDPCFILDTLIDDAKRKGNPLYVCFIDFAKAYDFVDRSALFCKMIGQGAARCNQVNNSECTTWRVKRHRAISGGKINRDVFSLPAFLMYIADLPEWIAQHGCRGVGLHDVWVRILLYADDGALLADTPEDLQQMLDALKLYCAKWRMHVNDIVKKT